MRTRRPDVICDCQQCGKKFPVAAPNYDARVRAGYPPHFCSRVCMGMSWRTKSRETRVCQHCREPYFYQPGRTTHGVERKRGTLYCSKECQASAISAAAADPEFVGYTRGRRRDSNGYIVRRRADGGADAKEHILVMEQSLGRKLLKGEQVHHVNGQRADNRPRNLELWNTSQPAGQRVSDKIEFAKEILAEYGLSFQYTTASDVVSGVAGLI
jgi:hypothetical protein